MINVGNTTQHQGDPISVYIFILVLEVLSFLVRNNKEIKGLIILDHLFLYTFFLENKGSIEELATTFTLFSSFSGLKLYISECKICGLPPSSLKGVEISVCGMQSADLTRDALKVLGIFLLINT